MEAQKKDFRNPTKNPKTLNPHIPSNNCQLLLSEPRSVGIVLPLREGEEDPTPKP